MSRGLDVMYRAESQMKNKGGSSWRNKLMLKPDDGAVPLRYRGVLAKLRTTYSEGELRSFNKAQLIWHAMDCGATYKGDMNLNDIIKSIKDRYSYTEPYFYARHYTERNAGKQGLSPYSNCGDPDATTGEHASKCRICVAIANGDRGLGFAQSTFAFTFWDYRAQHVIKKGGDEKNEYEICTVDTKGVCVHCSHNRRVGEKSDQARPKYDMGNRFLELSISAAKSLIACEQRVMRRCRSCTTGQLTPIGAYCPNSECYQPMDLEELVVSGWDIDARSHVQCAHCNLQVMPELQYQCNICEDPTSSRLFDVDLLVGVTKDGNTKKSKNTYQFTEQIPVRPLNPDDEGDAKILATPMFNFEEMLAPPSIEEQLKYIGTMEDPLGEVQLRGAQRGPPAGRMASDRPAPPTMGPPKNLPTVVPPGKSVSAVPGKKSAIAFQMAQPTTKSAGPFGKMKFRLGK